MKTIALRFNDTYSPEEGMIYYHNDIIKKNGYVWYGKFGNRLSPKNMVDLEELKGNNKRVLFVKNGMKDIYWAYFEKIEYDNYELEYVPEYYRDDVSKINTWIKITKFEKVDPEILEKCTVVSSQKKLSEAIKHSMNPCFVIDFK